MHVLPTLQARDAAPLRYVRLLLQCSEYPLLDLGLGLVAGMILPAVLCAPYLLFFFGRAGLMLTSATARVWPRARSSSWASCDYGFEVYTAAHVVLLYLYQFDFFQRSSGELMWLGLVKFWETEEHRADQLDDARLGNGIGHNLQLWMRVLLGLTGIGV